MVSKTSRLDTAEAAASRVGPIQGVTAGASFVLNDALDLAELQAKLLKADAAKSFESVKTSALGAALAVCMLLASLPVLALGLSSLLQWSLDWPLWGCQLLVGGLFALTGTGIGIWCIKHLRTAAAAFSTSQREGVENLQWLKQAIRRSISV